MQVRSPERRCLANRVLVGLWLMMATSRFVWAAPGADSAPQPPVLLQFVEAQWPTDSRAESAVVALRLTIDPTGTVTEVEVQSVVVLPEDVTAGESRAFAQAAKVATRQFRFQPASFQCVPTAVRIAYRYRFARKTQQAAVARFAGEVVRRRTGVPVPGVRVQVEAGPGGLTDAQGRFSLDGVPPGARRVLLSGSDVASTQVQETFVAGERLTVRYETSAPPRRDTGPKDDIELVVVAPPLRRKLVSAEVDATLATRVPGTSGDVVRVVESMPGVARPPAGSGALVVWGAAPNDTRVVVDGVPLPRLWHQGGVRSVLHPSLVRAVEVVPGATGAAWGRGLGGLVRVETSRLEGDAVKVGVSADVFDVSGFVQAPVGSGHLQAAARQGWLARWTELAIGDRLAGFAAVPRFTDAQLRWQQPLSRDATLDAVVLVSGDEGRRGVADPDPLFGTLEQRTQRFARTWLRWRQGQEGGESSEVVPWLGWDQQQLRRQVGLAGTEQSSTAWSGGLRASHRARAGRGLWLSAGLDLEFSQTRLSRQGAPSDPPREGDPAVLGQPVADQLAVDDWRVVQAGAAPWLELSWTPTPTVVITPGVRFDPLLQGVSRALPTLPSVPPTGLDKTDFALEPRLDLRWLPTTALRLQVAAGRVRQLAQPNDLSSVFGNAALAPARGWHALVGAALQVNAHLALEGLAFGARTEGLAVRSAAASPALGQALVPTGEGRVQGAQLTLRLQPLNGWFGWLAWTVLVSERRDREGSGWRPAEQDQTHLGSLAAGWQRNGWELGVRARVASGQPVTPVLGAWLDVRSDQWQPLTGGVYTDRLPTFVQIDGRAGKRWQWGRQSLAVWLEVYNASNHANVEAWAWSRDFSRRGAVGGLPILPTLGAAWQM
jgi:hypothetical protein